MISRRKIMAILLALLFILPLAQAGSSASLLPTSVAINGSQSEALLGLPQGETRPIVILLHGRHLQSDDDQTPYYKGLEYLVKALADAGLVALAIDLNPVYRSAEEEVGETIALIDAHLAALPVEAKAKADTSTLYVIGHSRGGGMAPLIANYYLAQGRKVPGCLLLAPTSYIGVLSEDGKTAIGTSPFAIPRYKATVSANVQVPTAIIIPQFDGDIPEMPGYSFWLNAIQQSKPLVPVMVAYLHDANHASFNSLLDGHDDPTVFPSAKLAKPQEIRAFTSRFALDTLTGKAPLQSFFKPDAFAAYPLPAAMTVYAPGAVSLLANQPSPSPSPSPFQAPGFDGSPDSHMALRSLSWQEKGWQTWLELAPASTTAQDSLLVYWALDATSPLNGQETALSLMLEDAAGKHAALPFSSGSTLSLFKESGQWEENPLGQQVFSHATPILTQIIPLASFQGIDAGHLKHIGVQGQSAQGALMLYDIQLMKAD